MVDLPQHLIDSDTQRSELRDAIEAWKTLRYAQWNNRGQRPALENVLKILRFLGLQCDSRGVQEVSTRSTAQTSPARRHITVELEQEGMVRLKGIPQFGSNANNIYDVVCTWNYRPHGITSLNAVTSNALGGQNALIVIYFDGLTKAERNEIRRNCIKDNLSFVLLDEILFEFLANIERDSRFETFINCGLAYSAPNPYIPEDKWGDPVPPEMFYGREDVASDIENMSGGTHFLFGGRQVGKTALLRHIEKRGNDRAGRRFTWFIDLKAEQYSPGARDKDPNDIWEILLRLCKEEGVTGEEPEDVPSEVIPGILRRAFLQDPRLRILVMFDESDRFLELDMASGSLVVESMRVLMVDTNNRFKVVFAGLHSVQRFERRENTPLRNLGVNPRSPRRGGLEPLKFDEAQRFVIEPMRAMGIEFENRLLVDTILTHTECQPSELQFFCHRLVQLLRHRGPSESPPYLVRQSLVDEVAASRNIREGIRGRYDETFRLDERYRAISLAMVLYYHGSDASELGSLSVNQVRYQVLDLFDSNEWWKKFDESKLPSLELEALLNELVGLGILRQHGTGYRVRSQRIARVFGSGDDILNEITQINEGR